MGVSFYIPLFWFYIPLGITIAVALFYVILANSNDTSGAGMVGFFLMVPSAGIIVLSWMIYFACGMFLGIR